MADPKEPKGVPPLCDVPGCKMPASMCTDGTEQDQQALERPDLKPRPAVKNLNVCPRHANWPHSNDAKVFAASSAEYQGRK